MKGRVLGRKHIGERVTTVAKNRMAHCITSAREITKSCKYEIE